MAIEREHKYLVKDSSYRDLASWKRELKQGYLCREPERTVRVRIADGTGFITIKGKNDGDRRLEFEYQVPLRDAEQMLKMCKGKVLSKTRYIVPYEGFTWEVDEFHGDLAPLITAEVELPDECNDYPLPPFIGDNVTGDPRYYNSNL